MSEIGFHAAVRHSERCPELLDKTNPKAQNAPRSSYMPDAINLLASWRSGSWSTQESSTSDQDCTDQRDEAEQAPKTYEPPGNQQHPTSLSQFSSWICLPDLNDITEDALPSCHFESVLGAQSMHCPCNPSTGGTCRGTLPTTPPAMPASTPILAALVDSDSLFPFKDVQQFPLVSTSTANKGLGHRIDFDEAFSQGRLLPYMVDYCVAGVDINQEEHVTMRWNGYLPLDPMPDAFTPPARRFLNRRRVHKETLNLDICRPSELSLVCYDVSLPSVPLFVDA
jgi:hypothetical protein